jgi:hypothetical protein
LNIARWIHSAAKFEFICLFSLLRAELSSLKNGIADKLCLASKGRCALRKAISTSRR